MVAQTRTRDRHNSLWVDFAEVKRCVTILQVLEQCSVIEPCAWQLRRGFLEVGTTSRLSVPAAREIRWYPIDELVYEAPDFDNAIDLRLEAAFPTYGGFAS